MGNSAPQTQLHTWIDRFAIVIATAFGSGYCPIAPGTAGSALSVLLWIGLHRWYPATLQAPIHVAWIALLTLIGIWASTRSENWFGKVDPRETVIDEVVGQQIAYLGLISFDWKSLLAGFILFRLFDVWKPFPIKKVQDLHGGTGIVLDDVVAGAYAWVVVLALRKFFHWM
jgi:phosphatidylglycerophosphatase A